MLRTVLNPLVDKGLGCDRSEWKRFLGDSDLFAPQNFEWLLRARHGIFPKGSAGKMVLQ